MKQYIQILSLLVLLAKALGQDIPAYDPSNNEIASTTTIPTTMSTTVLATTKSPSTKTPSKANPESCYYIRETEACRYYILKLNLEFIDIL